MKKTKEQIELERYLQWKYQTIANMSKKEFAELMKIMGKK